MNLFGAAPKEYEPRDVIIIFGSNGTADIATVLEIDSERILAAGEVEYSIPIADVKPYSGKRGRIFSYKASEENITDTKRLAELEKSIVLKQITLFEKQKFADEPMKWPIGKMIIGGIGIFLLVLFLALK
ncbi:hypothetical protein [Paenibacillus agricola]|uniref:Uncharacterized protein n=1 Tax=Paenibacillus agricola TaxID=2716264 RepID=A0ABX0JMA7_9BACL|nr:hypothetical protein [Paenibacillus agricola]NHN35561.1 hypothetical protein [Paenibacillus agricola]